VVGRKRDSVDHDRAAISILDLFNDAFEQR
jgi:hypothetical protein